MNYSSPHKLEMYAFYWSELRLLIAALALFLGGIPPALLILPASALTTVLLKTAWILSGIASLYLAYRWYTNKQVLFGKKDPIDAVAFFIMVISGINLGLTGILNNNIGMSILSGRIVFAVAALAYVWAAYYLWKRWSSHGKRMF